MTKTYTPLIIEGKIYVVVDAPEKPELANYEPPNEQMWYEYDMNLYTGKILLCTKYETLPDHAPYWKERIGQRVEVEFWSQPPVDAYDFDSNGYFLEEEYEQALLDYDDTEYAIPKRELPPQQKQVIAKDYHEQILDIIEDNERECIGSNEANIQSASQINQLIHDILGQQKQGDEWDEAEQAFYNQLGFCEGISDFSTALFTWFKSNYDLTKRIK